MASGRVPKTNRSVFIVEQCSGKDHSLQKIKFLGELLILCRGRLEILLYSANKKIQIKGCVFYWASENLILSFHITTTSAQTNRMIERIFVYSKPTSVKLAIRNSN